MLCKFADCEWSEFWCTNGECVNSPYVCDGNDDCGDNSDERSCGGRYSGDMHDERTSAVVVGIVEIFLIKSAEVDIVRISLIETAEVT